MNRKALLDEIRRRNRDHLPVLLAALECVTAGIRLTRADHQAVSSRPLTMGHLWSASRASRS
jgi:hypothetical protein